MFDQTYIIRGLLAKQDEDRTLVIITLPVPGECAAHLAARAFMSMLGLPARSVPAAGDTTQSPAAAVDKNLADWRWLMATRPLATRHANILIL